MMDGRANFEPFVEISERGRDLVALGLHVKTCPQTLRDITRVNLIGDNLVYLVIGCRCAGPNGVTCNNLPAVKTGSSAGGCIVEPMGGRWPFGTPNVARTRSQLFRYANHRP